MSGCYEFSTNEILMYVSHHRASISGSTILQNEKWMFNEYRGVFEHEFERVSANFNVYVLQST